MTRDILEKAFDKTKEIEEKQLKKIAAAEALGKVLGWTVAMALDAVITWAALNYMIGVSVSFLSVLGGFLLLQILLTKVSMTLK